LAQAFFGTFDFQQRDRFGDFEDDRFGRNAMTGGVGDQPGDEFRCEQLAFGDVEGEAQIGASRTPALKLLERPAADEVSEV